MFGPKHTFNSVIVDLVEGLEAGKTIPRPEKSSGSGVLWVEVMIGIGGALARHRRRATILIFVGLAAWTVSIAILLLPIVAHSLGREFGTEFGWGLAALLLMTIATASLGIHSGLKSRERSIELNAFMQILKMADPDTARQLMRRVAPRLRAIASVRSIHGRAIALFEGADSAGRMRRVLEDAPSCRRQRRWIVRKVRLRGLDAPYESTDRPKGQQQACIGHRRLAEEDDRGSLGKTFAAENRA